MKNTTLRFVIIHTHTHTHIRLTQTNKACAVSALEHQEHSLFRKEAAEEGWCQPGETRQKCPQQKNTGLSKRPGEVLKKPGNCAPNAEQKRPEGRGR